MVFDASALLALIHREPGWETVRNHLRGSVISTVNLSEAIAKLRESGVALEEAMALVDLGIVPILFNERLAAVAADLRPLTRELGLSLGDRCCLATAWLLDTPALTADARWHEVDVEGIAVELIR